MRCHDPETDLYYYRNRMMSAELGRFLQRDPLGYVDGYNLYEYVGGHAVNAWDPYGLSWIRRRARNIANAARYTGAFAAGFVEGLSSERRNEYWGEKLSQPDTTVGQLVAGDIYDPDGIHPVEEALKPDFSRSVSATIAMATFTVIDATGKGCYQKCVSFSPTTLIGAGGSQNFVGRSRTRTSVFVGVHQYASISGADGSLNLNLGKALGAPVGINITLTCMKLNVYDVDGCPCPKPKY